MRKWTLVLIALAALLTGAAYLWVDDPSGEAVSDEPTAPATEVSGSTSRPAVPKPRQNQSSEAAARENTPPLARGGIEARISANGKPVPGAQVSLYWRGALDPNTNTLAWQSAGQAVTDKDGIAKLRARPGGYLISARSPGYAPARRTWVQPGGDVWTKLDLKLTTGVMLEGRTVIRGRSEPVPLAEIELIAYPPSEDGYDTPDLPNDERVYTTSNSHGRFRISGLASGRYRVLARAPGYSRFSERELRVPRYGELIIGLTPASILEGFVLLEDGTPVAGAEVSVIGPEEPVVVGTGPNGEYLAEVESGTHRVWARRGNQTGALSSPVSVAPGGTISNLVVRLGPGAFIEGRVFEVGSEAPVVGASVAVSPYLLSGDMGRAKTDTDGRFRVEGLAPGSYDVAVTADGFSEALRRGITVGAGQNFPLDIPVHGAGGIEGKVVDGAGRPVADAYVRAISWGSDLGTIPETRSNSEGEFRLVGIPAGRTQVLASRLGASSGASKLLQVKSGELTRTEIQLSDHGTVTGRVTLEGGAAPTEALVVRVRPVGHAPGGPWGSTRDVEGNTYKMDLPAGRYQILARQKNAPVQSWGGKEVQITIRPGETVYQDLVVRKARVALRGRVLEPEGAPAAGAWVWLSSATGLLKHGIFLAADDEGRFEVSDSMGISPEDRLELRARRGGRTGDVRDVPGAGADVTIQLRRPASLMGLISSDDGGAVRGFRISVAQVDSETPDGRTEELEFSGDQYTLDDVPAGRLEVRARAVDGKTGTGYVSLTPGEAGRLDIVVKELQDAAKVEIPRK